VKLIKARTNFSRFWAMNCAIHSLPSVMQPSCCCAFPNGSQTHLAAQMLQRQSAQLTRLMDDLLDVGRITQGRVQLRCEPIDLANVIAQAVETIEPKPREKQQEISIVTSTARALYVHGDVLRLVQCVGNVLANASKYTESHGKIRIEMRTEGSPSAWISSAPVDRRR